MEEIRLYVYTDAPKNRQAECKARYELRFVKDGQSRGVRQYETGRLYETRYGATLEGVISGLEHINDTSGLPLTLVTNCDDVLTNYNQSERYRKWKVNGWLSAKGSLVAHHEKWRRLTELVERKVSRMDARAEDASETEIMRGLGAEPFNPYAKLTATSSNY